MAATSMRIPGKHQTPLKTLNRGNNFLRSHRTANTAKRKSAVELLQESKAFYVKSETVLDRQQQLKHAGHLQVTSSVDTVFLRGPRPRSDPAPDHKYIHPHVLLLSPSVAPVVAAPVASRTPAPVPAACAPTPPQPAAAAPAPPLPPKSPRLVSAAQRRAGSHPSGGSDQLQTKLRRLLNADSKENLFVGGGGGGAWVDDDSKTVACDERPFTRNVCPRSPAGCSIHKSLPDLHAGAVTSPTTSTNDSEIRSVSRLGRRSLCSAMSTHSSGGMAQKALKESAQKNIHNATPTAHSHHRVHSIVKTDIIHIPRSGAQSLDMYKNEVSADSVLKTPASARKNARLKDINDVRDGPTSNSSFSDSGAEDISSPKPMRVTPINNAIDRHHPILRSKSDISHRYSRGNISTVKSLPPEPYSDEKLEQFFEQLGLEASDYKSLSTPLSDSSSPIFFDSVSSVDSAVVCGPESGGTSGNHQRPSEQLSIVERNARIIKWLCNCRKAQLATHSPS